jgi:nucleoside-diphosphate-sugar epimerase
MNNSLDIKQLKQPVVVTGALGFIGRRTIDALLELGATELVAFDLPGLSMPTEWENKVTYIDGDISRQADVERAMSGAGTVIHLAAMVGDWIPLPQHEKVTVEGSRLLFDAALKNDTRVVLSSSIVVYADKLTSGPCPEDKTWGTFVGPYSYCKQKQETLAWDYYNNKNLPLSIVRPANVYGPGSKPWVHDVVDTLKTGSPVLINGGNFNAALVHVDNVVQLLLLAATKDAALGQVFNGGDGNTTSWRTYMSDLANTLDLPAPKSAPLWLLKPLTGVIEKTWRLLNLKKRPPLTKEALNLVGAETIIPINKAIDLLNYQPDVTYSEGLEQVKNYLNTHY